MPIFFKSKLIHLHIPRSGGTSVNNFFYKILDFNHEKVPEKPDLSALYGLLRDSNHQLIELDHLTLDMLKQFTSPFVYENFKKFCILRDPYDRLISEYRRQVLRDDKRLFNNIKGLSAIDWAVKVLEIFQNGVINNLGHFEKCHILPQSHYFIDVNNILSAKILNFGSLEKDFIEFLDESDIPLQGVSLPKLNITNNFYLNTHDSQFIKKIAEEIYCEDYKFFESKYEIRNH